MKIAEIRRTIESCNWARNDLSGSTLSEFKLCNVPLRLIKHIDAVRALKIAPRFERDIHAQAWAIECAEKMIERWRALQ